MLTVILTGGASRRMGRDKAMLPYAGTTLLQYLINKYSMLGPVTVSVNELGRFPFTGAAELADRYPNLGPLNGIVSGFTETAEECLFLTGTDLPYGETALVERLAALMGDADACILRRGAKGMEPLFAVYGRACCRAALDCLERGEKSFFEMLRRVTVRYVLPEELPEFDLERILTNVNTPEEFEKLQ